jgi:hypothetical protein
MMLIHNYRPASNKHLSSLFSIFYVVVKCFHSFSLTSKKEYNIY